MKLRLVLLSSLFAFGVLRAQTPGSADPAFSNDNNTEGQVIQTAPAADGKVLVLFNHNNATTVERLNADGTLDATFASITLPLPGLAKAFAVQPDQKIVVVGAGVVGISQVPITRLKADGTQDATFQPGAFGSPSSTGSIFAVAIDGANKILIGGNFQDYNSTPRPGLARLNSDGSLDEGFAPPTADVVFSVALAVNFQNITDNGGNPVEQAVLVAGDVTISGIPTSGIIRLHADGSLDQAFARQSITTNGQPLQSFYNLALAVQTDGKIVLGGNFTTVGMNSKSYVARLLATGSVDQSFTPFADAPVAALALQTDGKILLGGSFVNVSGLARRGVARLKTDGEVDTTFDPGAGPGGGGTPFIQTVALQADGKVLVGGGFAGFGAATRDNLARLLGDAVTPPAGDALIVPGTANPFLAGQPDGVTAAEGDTAPAQSPVLVPNVTLTPNKPLTFAVTGSVSNDAATPPASGPDGGPYNGVTYYLHPNENSLTGIKAPINSLVGVFINDNQPAPQSGASGTPYDYSDTTAPDGGLNATGTRPDLNHVFFIGDGKNLSGAVQQFYPPEGATRLFLGTLDGAKYSDNLGQFAVTVSPGTYDGSNLVIGQSVTTPTSADGSSALIGDPITYTLHVKNLSNAPIDNVVVRDFLPSRTIFVSASDGGTIGGNQVVWNLGTLAPTGAANSRDLTVVVKTFAGDFNNPGFSINTDVLNSLYSVKGDFYPVQLGRDQQNYTTLVSPIDVKIVSNAGSVKPGGQLTYTVTLTNTTGAKIKKPVVRIDLPGNVKNPVAAYVSGAPSGSTFEINGGSAAIFSLGNLKGNDVVVFTLTVNVPYDVAPGADVGIVGAQLTTKTSDDNGQNSYAIAPPTIKLSTDGLQQIPVLTLSKLTIDPYSLGALFLFDYKRAKALAAAYPELGLYKTDDFGQLVVDPQAILQLGALFNPYIGDDPEGGPNNTDISTIAAPSKKAPVTYATFALVYQNDGNVKTEDVVINEPIPDGFEYDPKMTPKNDALPSPFVLINGAAPTKDTFKAKGRTLKFTPGKAKPGKPGLIIYQLKVSDPGAAGVNRVLPLTRASLATNSLNSTVYSDQGNSGSLLLVGPTHSLLEPQNHGNYARAGNTVSFDLYFKNDSVAKYNDFLVACKQPAGVTFAASTFLTADGQTPRGADSSLGEQPAPSAPDAAGNFVFHNGKLKPGEAGFVRISYTLGAALAAQDHPVVLNPWVGADANVDGSFPSAAHEALTRMASGGKQIKDAGAGVSTATSGAFVLDDNLPRLFTAKVAPLAVAQDQTYDYLVAVGNLSDVPTKGSRTNSADGIIAHETLPADVSFVRLQGNDNRPVSVSGNVVTYQIPQIAQHQTYVIRITVQPKQGSLGKTLSSSTSVDVPGAPILSTLPTITRVVDPSQLALQSGDVAGTALTNLGVNAKQLPNFGRLLTVASNTVVLVGADAVTFNNGVVLIPQGNGAATLIGNKSSITYPELTAIGGSLVTANGAVVAVDAANVLRVTNLADNANRPLLTGAGRDCQTILSEIDSGAAGNLVKAAGATPNNFGGLNLYDALGKNFISNDPAPVVSEINHLALLAPNGSVVPAGIANSDLSNRKLQPHDQASKDGSRLINQDGAGLISQDGGQLISQDGGQLINQDGAGIISHDGGFLVAQGAGNLIASGGGNLIASGGGNAIGTPPSSALIAQGAGNLIAAGAGNLIAAGAGNLIASGGGN